MRQAPWRPWCSQPGRSNQQAPEVRRGSRGMYASCVRAHPCLGLETARAARQYRRGEWQGRQVESSWEHFGMGVARARHNETLTGRLAARYRGQMRKNFGEFAVDNQAERLWKTAEKSNCVTSRCRYSSRCSALEGRWYRGRPCDNNSGATVPMSPSTMV